MRIKGKSKNGRSWHWSLLLPAVGIALVVLLVLGLGRRPDVDAYYFCDMEQTAEEGTVFRTADYDFSNGQTQSNAMAFGGNYSARCGGQLQYGPGVTLKNLQAGNVIEAKVWRQSGQGHGSLALQGAGGWEFIVESAEPVEIVRGWELLEVRAIVPIGVKKGKLLVFPYAIQGTVFFDDLEVRLTRKTADTKLIAANFKPEQLNLEVDDKSMQHFQRKRAEALARGVLLADDSDLEKGKLFTANGEISVQARLKGDLTDHLQGSKWSFRILSEEKETWRGMPEFSVHNSLSRDHLSEWMYHQLLQRQDVLTTRYDFIEMALNDQPLGIYAYEEHFSPTLLRQHDREVAPIVRWNEDGLWLNASTGFGQRPPWFESAQIEAFGGKSVLKDNEQAAYFETARNFLFSAVQGTKSPGRVFDTQRMANFLAITDLCLAHHALNQTNLRFYFDPVMARLQPVGYDGYTPDGTWAYQLPVLTGSKINSRTPLHFSTTNDYNPLHHTLFNDFEFAEKYIAALERFISPAYLDQLKVELLNEIEARRQFLNREYTDYHFTWDYFFRNAQEIRKVLYPIEGISLKAYHANGVLTLESYHSLPLEIVGFGDNEITDQPYSRLILESFNEDVPVRRYQVPEAEKVKFVFCKTLGTSKLTKVPVMRWAVPDDEAPSPRKPTMNDLLAYDFISLDATGAIRVAPGQHRLTRSLLVPKGRRFVVSAGTEIILEDAAAIVSFSPVEFIGTPDRPIRIFSERRTGQGLLVLQAEGESVFQHVVFENLNSRNQNGRRTEAAVAFYETEVSLKNCRFVDLQSKDALGFIRCQYRVTDCTFVNTPADAIDADFSTGNLDGLTFERIGKDAIEISGGTASIGQVRVSQSLGKALNVTHRATVTAKKVEVVDSKQGIAATDLAKLTVEFLSLKNVQQGILAYQRLPEFGGSKVEVKKAESSNVKQAYRLEDGSVILIGGKPVGVN